MRQNVSIARRFAHKDTIRKNALEAAALIGASVQIDESDVNIHFCSGKGIKDVSPKGKQAIRLLAREEGIFLDPIYTGKGFAGLMELIDAGYSQPNENILFIHTGGTVSLINTFIYGMRRAELFQCFQTFLRFFEKISEWMGSD